MPLIVSYPGQIPADTRSDAIIENIDFPVTLLDFAGCSAPDYMQGSSFRSILQSGRNRMIGREPLTINTGCIWRITMCLAILQCEQNAIN